MGQKIEIIEQDKVEKEEEQKPKETRGKLLLPLAYTDGYGEFDSIEDWNIYTASFR